MTHERLIMMSGDVAIWEDEDDLIRHPAMRIQAMTAKQWIRRGRSIQHLTMAMASRTTSGGLTTRGTMASDTLTTQGDGANDGADKFPIGKQSVSRAGRRPFFKSSMDQVPGR